MNDKLAEYARAEIKKGLGLLPDSHVNLFKRMYSHDNMELPIDEVVDNMPDEKLDWALQQVENTLNNS